MNIAQDFDDWDITQEWRASKVEYELQCRKWWTRWGLAWFWITSFHAHVRARA